MMLYPLTVIDRSFGTPDQVSYWLRPSSFKRKFIKDYDTKTKRAKKRKESGSAKHT
ncbi:hypothetical protein PtrSN002B_011416 [Pyrenophora tritici-repentis]|uniref:Uncharacterized protein n=1 Tax=Pyrenophora tritici-repentis TaxID=45151 RepID=A0A317AFZ6_9PLEO|nr:hypothetical protein PtrV1_00421 [Pyrenophora tritici-repentis]KAF7576195.1 hypothetical protein PtrM4_004350 [Pyrenophora tritici-repentis]KAI0611552.1 hypothetical protein TUN205_04164 [Pyrenophora tritici-repentis]KAI1520035.1 hypothetical protein Ptr86124_000403 [Pyrenophora tritici-repentis]KAI1523874.1 hypothetical protein PtrSN001C_011271 [Pyrenophora tritici-repentis]